MSSNVKSLFDHDKVQYHPTEPPLPHNQQCEQALLGAIIAKNTAFEQVATYLRPEHFFFAVHGRLYAEIARRIVIGQKVDCIALDSWFAADEGVDELEEGSRRYLLGLVSSIVAYDIGRYGQEIRDDFIRREVIERSKLLSEDARDHRVPITDLTMQMTSAIDAIAFGQPEEGSKSFDTILADTITKAKDAAETRQSWIKINGFPRLYQKVSFQPAQFTVLGGRQGEGKSALAFGWAVDAARNLRDTGLPITTTGGIVAISLDMPDHMVGARALAAASGVDVNAIVEQRIDPGQLERLEQAREELKGLPLRVISGSSLPPSIIKMRVRQAQRALGGQLRLIMIDHFHLMTFEQGAERAGGPAFAYQKNANEIHGWCKEGQFNCHVIALVQLNIKEMAQRADKTPTRADIKWATALSDNADNILFAYRPIMDLPKTPPKRNPEEYHDDYRKRVEEWQHQRDQMRDQAFLVLDKIRSGSNEDGSIPLLFDGRLTQLTEDPGKKGGGFDDVY